MTEHFTMQGLVDRIEALEAQQKAAFKLGRNAGLEEARAEAIHWQDLSNSHKCGFYIAAVIESLKDNTP